MPLLFFFDPYLVPFIYLKCNQYSNNYEYYFSNSIVALYLLKLLATPGHLFSATSCCLIFLKKFIIGLLVDLK